MIGPVPLHLVGSQTWNDVLTNTAFLICGRSLFSNAAAEVFICSPGQCSHILSVSWNRCQTPAKCSTSFCIGDLQWWNVIQYKYFVIVLQFELTYSYVKKLHPHFCSCLFFLGVCVWLWILLPHVPTLLWNKWNLFCFRFMYLPKASITLVDAMETVNTSSGDEAGLFSASPYTTVEIVLIILVAGTLSLITVIGNILVMLSIKVSSLLWVKIEVKSVKLNVSTCLLDTNLPSEG